MMRLRYSLYIIVIILINIVATTIFFRIDLTENKSYSLSEASTELVKTLEEPLTIKVFLSENLPVPYNNLERDIRDILMEYQLEANKLFNYTIDIVKKDISDGLDEINPETYNIYPVNIQNIDQDEVKVVSAYIGMTFIHGDLVETIPAIQYNQNLELTITNTIRILTEKTTSLLSLKKDIDVTLYLSEILYQVSQDLINYSDGIQRVIVDLNSEYFNKINFQFINPTEEEIKSLQEKYDINTLSLEDQNGVVTKAVSSIVIEGEDSFNAKSIIEQDIFGRTVITNPEDLTDSIKSAVDKMIGAGTRVGYLVSNGTIPLEQNQMAMLTGGAQEPGINGLTSIINQSYTMSTVDLTQGHIRDDIKTLIIARPTQRFSDRELFLLDQFLLQGNSLLFAIDQFEMDMQQSNPQYGIEVYKLVDHGLKGLLEHHGIIISENMVMDMKSFNQMQKDNKGSITETQIYFAPLIQPENINNELSFLKGVNEIITFRMAEVKASDQDDNTVKELFSSSENAWFSTIENLTMSPQKIYPTGEFNSYNLGVVKDGDFSSYFANKEIPKKDIKDSDGIEETEVLDGVLESESMIKTSTKGKIVVLGSSDMLTDSILSNNYPSNILFIQNTIDYLSGRGDYTLMRSKGVFHRPMRETTSGLRNFIKYFNIVGLPLLVAIIGLISYLFWINKKKKVKAIFMGEHSEK